MKIKKITDEEMAKNYAIGRTYPKFETDYIANFVLREVEGAFLAGLNVYKPKWHKVADGDLPKVSGRYLVYTGGEPFILDFATELNSFGYWVVSLGDDCGVRGEDFETVKDRGEDDVIAWKELVPPKESEL